jgi:predicted RNA binding protein YcfA (HicA-like mRNA interferase family)
MKIREILSILRADGWYIIKTGGSSHRQLKHDTGIVKLLTILPSLCHNTRRHTPSRTEST